MDADTSHHVGSRSQRYPWRPAIPLLGALLLAVTLDPRVSGAPAARVPDTAGAAHTATQAANLLQQGVIRFEPNDGQAPVGVRFVAQSAHALWFFSAHMATLVLGNRGSRHALSTALRLTPVQASHSSTVRGAQPLSGTVNYLLGQTPRDWRGGIPTFAQVRYRSVYPGIDLIFHGHGTAMEYDWLVAPGANPHRIVLAVQGAHHSWLRSDGSVALATNWGSIRQLPPVIYQSVRGRRRRVPGHYILYGRDQLGLWIGPYDRARPLIVDPTLLYTAVLSGSLDDYVNGVTVDRVGNAYVTGATQSDDFPTRTPLQSSFGGETDAFVTKLDPNGKIVYSTYLGGNRSDEGYALTVDAAGDVFVAGATNSKNFPTTAGAFQTQLGGGTCPQGGRSFPCEDAFVAKLDPTGSRLLYSTYLGGKLDDWARGIALDGQDNAIVVGATYSPNFPAVLAVRGKLRAQTCGLYDVVYPCPDAFVAKLNSTGSGLLFSTYLGGKDDDEATAVAASPNGTISLTGETYSTDFPVVHGMRRIQRTHCKMVRAPAGRCPRAFVATLAANGSALLFSSYLGGSNRDWGNGIAVDGSGNVYVAGQTTSSDFPVVHPVQGAHYKGYCHDANSTDHYPCSDAFITKINVRIGKIIYSSHIGGTALDGASAVTVNSRGDAYVAGYAGSYNFPTLHAVQKHNGGGEDAFVVELTPAGTRAYFSTYLGGEHDDGANSIAIDGSGDVYVVGSTDSPKFPKKVKYGPVSRGLGAFVVRIRVGKLKPAPLPCALLYGEKKTGCVR